MRRLRHALLAMLLAAALMVAGAGAAFAHHDGDDYGTDDWSTVDEEWPSDWGDDEWYPDDEWVPGWDDEWYPDDEWAPDWDDEWYPDDEWAPDWDDEWYPDDEWAPDWDDGSSFDDGFSGDDEWTDPFISDDAVFDLLDQIDACPLDDALGSCVLAAIDAMFLSLFEDDFVDVGPGGFDDPFGDEYDFDPGEFGDDFDFGGFDDDFDPGGFDEGPFGGGGLDSADDPEAAAEIQARFNELIPAEWRDRIVDFSLESDGRDGVVAAVEPLNDDLSEWRLIVDPADADFELDSTLIHEFAHVLTLNETQVDAQFVFSEQEYEAAAAACSTYFTGEGCATTNSYIAQFVDRFWTPILDEFEAINSIESDIEWENAMFDFYDEHASQFVSDYAATNPGEDMAESFAAYVLAPELPDGDTIAEQKILFFNQFTELAQLRDSIRTAL